MSFFGNYGKFELFISLLIGAWLVYFDYKYIAVGFLVGIFPEQMQFMAVFLNLMGFIIVCLPIIVKLFEKIESKNIEAFIDLPKKDTPFTFSVVSGFLGEQALASFLATVLIFTGKIAIAEYGVLISAVYMAILFTVAITLAVVSLARFVSFFSKFSPLIYGFAALASTSIVFAFVNVGLNMAA
ncbi:hypothetical protein [Vibrio parahaemolyticus]|uniref:hypothetical protein n=1 Tax=Vibrio parahaemolyticus TaxID=670 RepID=UPI0011234784|nr:hypothetical protein [Vibrio parahaemolyticus]TOM77825.1 hypothetical protein CGH70_23780 [Vibrio parahaemolyticus]